REASDRAEHPARSRLGPTHRPRFDRKTVGLDLSARPPSAALPRRRTMGTQTSRHERPPHAVLAMALAWGLTVIGAGHARPGEDDRRAPDFHREIALLLATHCLKCHGDTESKGKLDLRTKEAMLKGGSTGPALTPGSADESLLFDLVSRGEMP